MHISIHITMKVKDESIAKKIASDLNNYLLNEKVLTMKISEVHHNPLIFREILKIDNRG